MKAGVRKKDGKNEEEWRRSVGAGVAGMGGGDACVALLLFSQSWINQVE
jgi:hypothetical protein